MDVKICTKCGESKDLSLFSPRAAGGHKSACKPCSAQSERERVKRKKAALGNATEHDYGHKALPPGFSIKGVSQFVGADGAVKAQWIKSDRDKDQALEDYIAALKLAFEDISGVMPATPAPVIELTDDLIDIVPIGDAHIGLMTWWDEVGENFDLKIARDMYARAYARLFANDTRAETLVMANLGDYFHTDGGKNATTKNTPVDVDGRWPKVLKTGVQIMIDAIGVALTKYKKVVIYSLAGNHDKEAAVALRLCLSLAFNSEPRVYVEESPRKYQFLEHGSCLIGFTHGDTSKPEALPMIMASDQREAWGRTEHRHYYTGHLHHDRLKDIGEVTVETVRVLGPADAWHTEAGYRSRRDIKIDTWSKKYGRIDRSVFGIRRIMDDYDR